MKNKLKNVILDYEGYSFKIEVPLFDEKKEVNLEEFLSIDITNLPGELITTPIVMNKFGILLADAEDNVREAKMNYEIWESKEIKRFRQKRSDDGEKNPTKPEVDEHIILHPVRPKKYKKFLEAQKTRDYINSIYWSFKEKQENLKKLSLTIGNDLDSSDIESALQKLKTIEYKGKVN